MEKNIRYVGYLKGVERRKHVKRKSINECKLCDWEGQDIVGHYEQVHNIDIISLIEQKVEREQ